MSESSRLPAARTAQCGASAWPLPAPGPSDAGRQGNATTLQAPLDPSVIGLIIGKIEWSDVIPHRRLVKGHLSLVRDEPMTQDVKRSRSFRLGDVYEFRIFQPAAIALPRSSTKRRCATRTGARRLPDLGPVGGAATGWGPAREACSGSFPRGVSRSPRTSQPTSQPTSSSATAQERFRG